MKYLISLTALTAFTEAALVLSVNLMTFQIACSLSQVVPLSWHLESGILNYALTLDYLEDKFYREGLANYTELDSITADLRTLSTTTRRIPPTMRPLTSQEYSCR
jgi:hypothetical protein